MDKTAGAGTSPGPASVESMLALSAGSTAFTFLMYSNYQKLLSWSESLRVINMAQQVKELAAKPENLSSISGTHLWKYRTNSHTLSVP